MGTFGSESGPASGPVPTHADAATSVDVPATERTGGGDGSNRSQLSARADNHHRADAGQLEFDADTEVIHGGKREPKTEIIDPFIARTEYIALTGSETEMFAPMLSERPAKSSAERNLTTFVFLVGFAVIFYFFFLPTVLGGPAGYVLVSGSSMEPTYHDNDLVVTHKEPEYQEGQVIAYRIPEGQPGAGAQIIHRVVGGNGETGYITKGDNRRLEDPWRPTNADVIGRQWFLVPKAGDYLNMLRTPIAIAILVGVLGTFVTLDILYTNSKPEEDLAVNETRWKRTSGGKRRDAGGGEPESDAALEAAAADAPTPGEGIEAAYEELTVVHELLTQLAVRSTNSEAAREKLEDAYRLLLDAYDELAEGFQDDI